ncbi:MAG: anti-sigma factor [Acetobacteraceae bacterium]|nr:anti-sigma factor [Acetobacteraceae bacterium]MBV8525959.1 anti-sigma factor [Acetobacteraceae bacterium]MBV8591190.1 anti-sigma factor [Acetobacteraceae bacterium]
MNDDRCQEMHLLIQADLDGELDPAEAARVAEHLEHCAACASLQSEMLALSARLREELPYYAAPHTLHAAVRARIASEAQPEAQRGARRSWVDHLRRPRLAEFGYFGGGFALAACLAWLLVIPRAGDFPGAVVADHIRALQPGHIMDVASSDQHTVKPWFGGRLDFTPPVKDLKSQGFALAGARLDYLAGRPVAALVYQRRQHLIDLFIWPDQGSIGLRPADGHRRGYNFIHWSQGGMVFWAVSDLNAQELGEFVRLWQAG